jgi:hypothetical protein
MFWAKMAIIFRLQFSSYKEIAVFVIIIHIIFICLWSLVCVFVEVAVFPLYCWCV